MPQYEFKCGKCDAQTEIKCNFDNKKENTPCCCGVEMDTLVSATTFDLKGSGWTPRGVGYLT